MIAVDILIFCSIKEYVTNTPDPLSPMWVPQKVFTGKKNLFGKKVYKTEKNLFLSSQPKIKPNQIDKLLIASPRKEMHIIMTGKLEIAIV